jgi:uncharacterized protein
LPGFRPDDGALASGVGLTYTPGIEGLLEADGGRRVRSVVVDCRVLAARREKGEHGSVDRLRLERICSLPGRKVLCGLGAPVGGARRPKPIPSTQLREVIDVLEPAWVSEELAFDHGGPPGDDFPTIVRLPVRQNLAGLSAAVCAVRSLAGRLPIPLALKNGTNYLKPRPDEMSDGAFLGGVAETAACGLVLDLGSLLTSARYGRQAPEAFLDEIPLGRVWELRVGSEAKLADDLLSLARRVLPRLPNLKCLVYEIGPRTAAALGSDGITRHIERLNALWEERFRAEPAARPRPPLGDDLLIPPGDGPEDWEDTLGALVVGRQVHGPLAEQLAKDPGLGLYRRRAAERRQAVVSSALPFAVRLLVLALGQAGVARLLEAFWRRESVDGLGPAGARRLAAFLAENAGSVPLLREVSAYDVAVLDALTTGARAVLAFDQDPRRVFADLADHRLPTRQPGGPRYEIEVWSDGIAVRPRLGPGGDEAA